MLCPTCYKTEAVKHPVFGIIPCVSCQLSRSQNSLPDGQVEMPGESIRDERLTHARSTIQPFRGGELSKEYVDMYGADKLKVTEKEIKNAKNTWTDIWSDNFDIKKTR